MITCDASQFKHFALAMGTAPEQLAGNLVRGFQEIATHDIALVRQAVTAGLNVRKKSLPKTFKYKASDKAKVDGDISKIFADLYTKWGGGEIFTKGGKVSPRFAGGLTILTSAARGSSGRRKWTTEQLRQMVKAGQLRLVRTSNELLIVMDKGGLTKTGKMRKNSRAEIIAVIRRNVQEPKRYDFYGTVEGQEAYHAAVIEDAIAEVFDVIEGSK